MELESKSVKELRQLAKQQGITNYSKLSKENLIRLLAGRKSADKGAGSQTIAAAGPPTPSDERSPVGTESIAKPGAAFTTEPDLRVDADEIQVEEAKYALAPPGIPEVVHPQRADLGEDIEALPSITKPLLCLLPQKPGVLHAYWVVDAPMFQRKSSLRLRLTRLTDHDIEILQEVAVTSASGHWYLHVAETEDPTEVYLQLGHYAPDGQFVTALRRGTVRVPTLGAARRIDPRWWFSDQQFHEMYLRAGGYVRGTRLGWAGPAASSR